MTVDPLTRAQSLIALFTTAEKLNNTGSVSPGVPRLGVPAYNWWQEALHGVAQSPGVNFSSDGDFSYATSFPQPILMGAAFDDDLIRAVADVISTEARAFNNEGRAGLDFWTPNINPFKYVHGSDSNDVYAIADLEQRSKMGTRSRDTRRGSIPSSFLRSCSHRRSPRRL